MNVIINILKHRYCSILNRTHMAIGGHKNNGTEHHAERNRYEDNPIQDKEKTRNSYCSKLTTFVCR